MLLILSLSAIVFAQKEKVTSKTSTKRTKAVVLSDLPQTPRVPKLTTDAQDENLKGKVKKIVVEMKYLSGDWVQYGRYLSGIIYFDEIGDLLRNEGYIKGKPYYTNVYGFIDGKRVSKDIPVKTESNGGSFTIDDDEVIIETQTLKKPDDRFEYSYEYKYEDGKQKEMQMFFNTGKKGMRYTKKYAKNSVERIVYTLNGKVNVKDIIALDDFGNEIEQLNYANSSIPNKYKYEYIFDKQGNWIKQLKSKEVTENEKSHFEPLYETYRTIAYY